MTSNVWRGKKLTNDLCSCGSGLNAIVYYSVIKVSWVKQCQRCRERGIAELTTPIRAITSNDQDKRNTKARKLLEELRDRDIMQSREVWE